MSLEQKADKEAQTDYSAESVNGEQVDWENVTSTESEIIRESTMLDIDRMVNEGLGGGNVTRDNGLIGHTTTDTMKTVDEAPGNMEKKKGE
ncbi:hypothetical protein [Paenibacillus faecalis]|uniref:hypothetical protein n=1 Tax=Paenibacillus faecalis TaxID=2079532 RepID=UPI000D0FE13E|nr:hypothetical protein [Paenibacillus faecalis]